MSIRKEYECPGFIEGQNTTVNQRTMPEKLVNFNAKTQLISNIYIMTI